MTSQAAGCDPRKISSSSSVAAIRLMCRKRPCEELQVHVRSYRSTLSLPASASCAQENPRCCSLSPQQLGGLERSQGWAFLPEMCCCYGYPRHNLKVFQLHLTTLRSVFQLMADSVAVPSSSPCDVVQPEGLQDPFPSQQEKIPPVLP